MPRPTPVLPLLAALAFACATPAGRVASGGDTNPARPGAALSQPAAQPIRVDGATARRLVAGGAKLVDVRDAESYALQHIEGAINVPVDEIAARAAAEIGPPGTSVVVYCRTGARSARAAATLVGLGYGGVYDLGSYLNWEGAAPAPAGAPKT